MYFDSVSQMRLPCWSRGRVVLAGELARAPGDHALAFDRYETKLRALVVPKQESALRMGAWFAPRTRLGIAVRNRISRWLDVPWVGQFALRGLAADGWRLPAYH